MKRFWDEATVVSEGGRFAIRLDARPLRLPGGIKLELPNEALANAIAAEWQQAGGYRGGDVQLQALPLTRLLVTAQERVAPSRDATINELTSYAESDLLCYRADSPPELAARQAANWQWLLDRAWSLYGARMTVTMGIMPARQTEAALSALRSRVRCLSNVDLAALCVVVPVTSSLILGLSLADAAIDAEEAVHLAFLDSDFQAEKWGEDAETLARRLAVAAEIGAAACFMALARA